MREACDEVRVIRRREPVGCRFHSAQPNKQHDQLRLGLPPELLRGRRTRRRDIRPAGPTRECRGFGDAASKHEQHVVRGDLRGQHGPPGDARRAVRPCHRCFARTLCEDEEPASRPWRRGGECEQARRGLHARPSVLRLAPPPCCSWSFDGPRRCRALPPTSSRRRRPLALCALARTPRVRRRWRTTAAARGTWAIARRSHREVYGPTNGNQNDMPLLVSAVTGAAQSFGVEVSLTRVASRTAAAHHAADDDDDRFNDSTMCIPLSSRARARLIQIGLFDGVMMPSAVD